MNMLNSTLKGANKYDYAFDLYFYPTENKGEVEPINLNDVRVGKQEGYLYKADQKGTLLVGVKDNGSYNLNGKSNYIFTAQTTIELPIDSLDMDNTENIQQFPFSTEGKNYTLLSKDQQSDQDYFTFSVNEPTTLKFDLSGIPGVTASMELYLKEDLDTVPTEEVDDEELYEAYPMQASYGTDKGDGVSLIVDAIPDAEYVLSVSNENGSDFLLDMFFGGGIENEESISESIIPYTLKGGVITLPKDEDGLPLNAEMLEDNVQNDSLPVDQYKTKERHETNDLLNMLMSPDAMGNLEEVDLIMEHAIRFDIDEDQKAYFQTEDDADYFQFKAKEDAVYGFQIKKGVNQTPAGTLFEYDEEKNELLPISSLTNDLGLIALLLGSTSDENAAKTIALKKDKTYVVKVVNYSDRSLEPYTLKTSKMADIPKDNNRDNNTPLGALAIQPGTTYNDHLVYKDDSDYYYYKQRDKDEVMSVLVSSILYTNEQLDELPKELQNDLKFSGSIIEDTNGNMQIDPKEMEKEVPFGQGENLIEQLLGIFGTTDVNTSFKAKKNHGYFILVNGNNLDQVSIQPYSLTMFDHTRVDEDANANSKLVNGVPTKPSKLTKKDDTLGSHSISKCRCSIW